METNNWISVEDVEGNPKLFRPLQWWEEREEKDMPEYLKTCDILIAEFGDFIKVDKYLTDNDIVVNILFNNEKIPILYFFPATETEYQQYINSRQ